METVTLSSKGQLVIPKQVRQLANLQAGDAFQVRFLDGEIRLRPVAHNRVSTLEEVAGCLANAGAGAGAKNVAPLSDEQMHAAIKARLKAEDAATMSRPVARSQKTTLKKAP